MALTRDDLEAFRAEVRRLAHAGEPPLYPAFAQLLARAYPADRRVDSLLRAPGAGFPDFTISRGRRIVGWVEVKHPSVSIDPLPAPDRARFDRYRTALPHVVLTNGWDWRLYEAGRETARAQAPHGWLTGERPLPEEAIAEVASILARAALLPPASARSYTDAVQLLATSAALIDEAVREAGRDTLPARLTEARDTFSDLLRTNPEDPSRISIDDFADALAQACTFGYLLARLEAGIDVDPSSAVDALGTEEHPFLKSTLHSMAAPDRELETALRGVLRTACDAVNAAAPMLAGPSGPWERVPYVYEGFFAAYRPRDRFRYGIFYTPEEITRFQVREIRRTLVQELGRTGLTDPSVTFLEPACGTGTYLLALAEEALIEAQAGGLPVAATLHELFRDRVAGLEVAPGPASVAQARLTAWLRAHGVRLGTRFPVYVANTLAPPSRGSAGAAYSNLWADSVSAEQAAGDAVKRDRPVLVVFGNPPWGDRPRETFRIGPPGTPGRRAASLIEDWARGQPRAVINLYDLYVAFWRFAAGMLLERGDVQDATGMVSFITNRTWLRGGAYGGMRRWLRRKLVSADVIDLGGDVRAGARRDDEPVFAIKAGSAIATLSFGGPTSLAGGAVRVRRLRGSRADKLRRLDEGDLPAREEVVADGAAPFGPLDWGALADAAPIDAFFAAGFPGVKTHRDDLIVNVASDALLQGLRAWNETADPAERSRAFNPNTRTPPSRGYSVKDQLVVRHRYRPLDDRYLYGDPLFIDRPGRISRFYEGGSATLSLITMDTRTGPGPVVIATDTLPGYNSFRGSYETHVFPLDEPPSDGCLSLGDRGERLSAPARAWAATLGADTREVGAYLLALGNAPSYAMTFAEALETEIVRFPATRDEGLFRDAVRVGHRLLAAWSLEAPATGRWQQTAPGTPLGAARAEGAGIAFANGDRLEGVPAGVFDLSVSRYPVLERFLGARAHLGLTVAPAEQIRRVVGAVTAIQAEEAACDALLARAVAAPMVRL